MNQRVAFANVVLAVLGFSLALPAVVAGQDAGTGSIKGEITASGVRTPEDVVVYIQEVAGEQKPSAKPASMDQKKLVFIPHVLPIVVGTTVDFRNGDPLLHNIFWPASDDGSYPGNNLGSWGQGDTRSFTFSKPGHVVCLCNIHAEMEGHIVVLQNPYFAVTGKEGTYEIKNVPPGQYTVATWYPKPTKLKSKSAPVTVEAGKAASLDFSLGRR
jgi:plastocyanin